MNTKPAPLPFRALVALFVAPWVLLFALVRILMWLVRIPRRIHWAFTDTITCPVGHRNQLLGRWTCSCGSTYLGHALQPCPFCNLPAGRFDCVTCGLTIRSPWKTR